MPRGCARLSVALMSLALWGAVCDRHAPTRAELEALIREGANREEVVRRLGPGYVLYEKSNPEMWQQFERFWEGGRLQGLREKADRYPKVMYWTTAWIMTFVFFC